MFMRLEDAHAFVMPLIKIPIWGSFGMGLCDSLEVFWGEKEEKGILKAKKNYTEARHSPQINAKRKCQENARKIPPKCQKMNGSRDQNSKAPNQSIYVNRSVNIEIK